MNTEQLWGIVEDQRRRTADFLGSLSQDEWGRPSLSEGWTVKDVAAHLAVVPHAPSVWRMLPMVVRARGSLDLVNHDIACAYARERQPHELVAELRGSATSRELPSVTSVQNLAMDIVVHGLDMAVPLGRTLPIPPDAALNALDRAWTMGWPFHARKRLSGYRLAATDADWFVGEGPLLRGTVVALLLLATGRVAPALALLEGEGVPLLSDADATLRRRRA